MEFVAGKVFWALAAPGNLLLLLALAGVLLLASGRRRIAGWCTCAAAMAFLAIAVLPLGEWILAPLEERFPPVEPIPDSVDGIIVLGGSVDPPVSAARGQPALTGSAERLTEFAALARRYPVARLVFSGGSGRLTTPDLKEAAAARVLLGSLGLPTDRVLWEDQSRNTAENARLSVALVDPQPGEIWLLVTSARHMPRAVGAFRAVGWPVIAHPADYLTEGRRAAPPRFDLLGGLAQVDAAAHEWLGLLVYRLRGDTAALYPAPSRAPPDQ